jgi:protein-L-isoaspartate(D-aspartate) O-methyltransferase
VTPFDNAKIRLIMTLRQAGIHDTKILAAIERIPRDVFVPPSFKDRAYDDGALPIGLGQTISQPYIVAYMTEALDIKDGDKILEIGTGCGYQAAILSKLCRRVYTIERHRPLLHIAEQNFNSLKLRNITAICADGMKGWVEQSPFDKIIVTASSEHDAPAPLLEQLSIGGILIIPIGAQGQTQTLRKYVRESADVYSKKDLLEVRFVPLLPDVPRASDYTLHEFEELSA